MSDVVACQYERWIYPEPIFDLPGWLAGNWQWFDPSHAHLMFWPDRGYKPDMDILVAGCGTNQAAVLAFTNPAANVVAIDVSQPSLDHHSALKDRYGMRNLELHLLPIEELGALGREFDLVISTGVLHHMAEPQTGMKALAGCLNPDGVIAVMLYGRYGRIGVEIMQSVFRDLALEQNEASLFAVKEAVALLPQDHPLHSYISMAPDLQFDAGIVDTFLHGRDRSYTVADCLDLVSSAGLIFQDWYLKSAYYPPTPPGGGFYAAVAALPEAQQWSVMERINTRNACHFFTACHADRAPESYRVDFASPTILDAAPTFRYRCGFDGSSIYRPGWRMNLDLEQRTIVQLIDGHRTIREIVEAVAQLGVPAPQRQVELQNRARLLLQSLWQQDFLAMVLGS
jgi:SAM-dependent methyltransferase